jgi:uncharacterized membrane protein YfcA
VKAGIVIMSAFLVFSYFGAQIAGFLPQNILKTSFGIGLILMGVKIAFF